MKKLTSLLLASILLISVLFSLASCSPAGLEKLDGKTPEELYAETLSALSETTSYDVTTSQVIKMSYGGESITMTQTVEATIDGENSYSKITSDMVPSMNMESWYVDGVCYVNTTEGKYKASISKSEYMEQYMNADPSEGTLLDIPKSWLEDIKFKKSGKSYTMTFKISADKFDELLANTGLDVASIVGDLKYVVFFDADGNLEKVELDFKMDVMGITANCKSTSTVTIGSTEVSAPQDKDSYTEISLG